MLTTKLLVRVLIGIGVSNSVLLMALIRDIRHMRDIEIEKRLSELENTQ